MIKNILGEGIVQNKTVIVVCENCLKEREIKYMSAIGKQNHICRSCSISKSNTGRKRSDEAKKNMSIVQRRLHNGGVRLNQGRGYKQIIVDEIGRAHV